MLLLERGRGLVPDLVKVLGVEGRGVRMYHIVIEACANQGGARIPKVWLLEVRLDKGAPAGQKPEASPEEQKETALKFHQSQRTNGGVVGECFGIEGEKFIKSNKIKGPFIAILIYLIICKWKRIAEDNSVFLHSKSPGEHAIVQSRLPQFNQRG